MKRIFILIATLTICLSVSAQQHLAFKGIEIDGTPAEMVKKLQEVGFVYKGVKDKQGVHYLTGKFAGYEATIGVLPNEDGITHTVAAAYDDGLRTWALILERFDYLETNLTKKYGQPSDVMKDVGGSSDGTYRIRDGEGTWAVTWETDNGIIMLYVFATEDWHQGVVVGYTDKINKSVDIQNAYDDL